MTYAHISHETPICRRRYIIDIHPGELNKKAIQLFESREITDISPPVLAVWYYDHSGMFSILALTIREYMP